MGLSAFIRENKQALVHDWVDFARDNIPPAKYMSRGGLQNHIVHILNFIADDLDSAQTFAEQRAKSEGLKLKSSGLESGAERHADLRLIEGFSAPEIGSEFRALRASITRQWERMRPRTNADYMEMIRFNEAVDQLFAESLLRYDHEVTQKKTDQSSLKATLHKEVRQRNLELNELNDKLKLALSSLKDSERRKDEFLAMLAHELRNPLAPIRNALAILKSGRTGEKQQKELHLIMERQLLKVIRLVDDLLDVSRITRGVISLKKEHVNLAQVVNHAVDSTRYLFDEYHHTISLSLPKEPLFVKGDDLRIEQALSNLLVNACKYTGAGGHIIVILEREAGKAIVRVIDNGIGIAPELLPHIFDLFVQAGRSLDRIQGGLGIGLTLVRHLVELHGGTVEAKSFGLKQGCEFIVRLPVIPEEGTALSAVPPVVYPKAAHVKRVLIVEDNADAAMTTRSLLELQGHTVQTAGDGLSGIKQAQIFKPEVVLLDIGLPGMDGYEVAKRLRQLPETKEAMLIALSGYGQPEDRLKSKEAGFDHHLVKPADINEIGTLISGT